MLHIRHHLLNRFYLCRNGPLDIFTSINNEKSCVLGVSRGRRHEQINCMASRIQQRTCYEHHLLSRTHRTHALGITISVIHIQIMFECIHSVRVSYHYDTWSSTSLRCATPTNERMDSWHPQCKPASQPVGAVPGVHKWTSLIYHVHKIPK